MNEAARANVAELTVSELSAALKRTVEDAYGYVRVRGEISGFRGPHSSGHCYFALKDAGAKIEAVIWKGTYSRIRTKPQEGLEVIATGRLTTYPGSSKYQIVIDALEPAGIGALMALMEERKRKLAAEGLFDAARKQLIPTLPAVIGVVTSPTGAVIRDILHRLNDRFPRPVLLWPVRVQGDGAAEEIAAAITGFNALPEKGRMARPDVLIVARGGGSLEDLWCFNEESVVRAVAESTIPLIAAVGHETDVTLIDFAADIRAPTPTAAAEMAVPVRAQCLLEVSNLERRSLASWRRAMDQRRITLTAALNALPYAASVLAIPRQRLDVAATALGHALRLATHAHFRRLAATGSHLTVGVLKAQIAHARRHAFGCAERLVGCRLRVVQTQQRRFATLDARLGAALKANADAQRLALARQREGIGQLDERSRRALATALARQRARLGHGGQLLDALSYRGVLSRGFVLVRAVGGAPLRTAVAAQHQNRVTLEFADGRVDARIVADRTDPGDRPQLQSLAECPEQAGTRRRGPAKDQGDLF